MPTYTVVDASQKKALDGKHGPMQVIALELQDDLAGAPKAAEWFTKASTPLPAVGERLEGDVTQGEYGLKFKKAQAAFNGGGGGGPRPEDPKRAAAIQRMHDQHMALRAVELASRLELVAAKDTAELFALVAKTADWFGKDVQRAREAA